MTDHDALAALPLTPEATTTERQRIRNLIDQFERGFHTADEMPGLILATLDAERGVRVTGDAGLREAALDVLAYLDADPTQTVVPDGRIAALRAALATPEDPT